MLVTAVVALCHYGNAEALFRAWGKDIRKNDDGFWNKEENKCAEFPSVNPGEGMSLVVFGYYISFASRHARLLWKTCSEFTLRPITVCSDMSQIRNIILKRICEEDRWKNPITTCLPCVHVWRSAHLVNECQKALLSIGDAVGWFNTHA